MYNGPTQYRLLHRENQLNMSAARRAGILVLDLKKSFQQVSNDMKSN